MKKKAKLTKGEKKALLEGGVIIGGLVAFQNKQILQRTLREERKFFDDNSSGGFLGLGKPKIDYNGKRLTKKEYLKEMTKNLVKNDVIKRETTFVDKKGKVKKRVRTNIKVLKSSIKHR